MYDLVGNPKDRVSRNTAQMILINMTGVQIQCREHNQHDVNLQIFSAKLNYIYRLLMGKMVLTLFLVVYLRTIQNIWRTIIAGFQLILIFVFAYMQRAGFLMMRLE